MCYPSYTPTMESKRRCIACKKVKPIRSFEQVRQRYRRRTCGACLEARKRQVNPERMRAKAAAARQRCPEGVILWDCRASDKKKGLTGNNLDREFIQEQIAKGCQYCGGRTLRMSLDRIDNSKAHTKENVVPCCIRCNYMRGSMPYEAWCHLVPAVREAHELGLFGDWRSTPFNLRKRK